MKPHWTSHSIKDFSFRVGLDFIAQLDKKMEYPPMSHSELATKLNVDKSRVSQVFNDPGKVKLETIVKYSQALNLKVAIVTYEDDDPENLKGPIDPEIFRICWEKADKPRDFWAFEEHHEEEMKQGPEPISTADSRLYMYGELTQQVANVAPFTVGVGDESQIRLQRNAVGQV